MADRNQQADEHEAPLQDAGCELPSTQPPMLGGLPRKVAGLIVFVCLSIIVWLDSLLHAAGVVVCGGVVWFAVCEVVAADLWGFDVFLAWCTTSFRFLDSGSREWGGARFAALPLRPRSPLGVSDHAA